MKFKVGDIVRTLVVADGVDEDESPIGSFGTVVDVSDLQGKQKLLVKSISFPDFFDNKWFFLGDQVELVGTK